VPAPVTEPPRPSEPWPRWADPAAIGVVFVALAAWTWEAWPDVLMDFGRELYVAWRMTEGDVLYRDVMSVYGPLSPHVNALAFRLFGVSLRALALCNMAILAGTVAGLWLLVRRGSAQGRWAPTTGAVVLLALCGFAQLTGLASFNFVAPYAHEATHGFALAVGAAVAALRLLETRRARWAGVSGVLCGLAFLTKPEGFVAGLGAGGALVWLALTGPGARPPRRRSLASFIGGVLAAPAFAFMGLTVQLGVARAGTALLGSWAYAGNEPLFQLPYFAWSLGTDDIGASGRALVRASALHAAVLAPAAGLAWIARHRPRFTGPLAAVAAVGTLLALAPAWRATAWLGMARPLPLWVLAAGGVSLWALRRRRSDEAAYAREAARFALAALALLMVLRIILHARLYHYGFVLAAPALLVLVAALVDWIPAALDRTGAAGTVFRSAALAALAVATAAHLAVTDGWLAAKTVVLGAGADRFRADVRGAYVKAALRGIAPMIGPEDTLVVLPEGVMLNYLLRMPTSIPYLTMLPTEVPLFGEDALLGALQRRPPTFILLVHRETGEYGQRFFGRDYALRVAEWISRSYVRVGGAGDPPLRPGSSFGVAALRRRPEVVPAPSPPLAPPRPGG
jgi:hypothetical protein